jgi:hypothetical protein
VEAYASAITIGMGLGFDKSEVKSLLAQARKIDEWAPEPYAAMAQYLLPRWHGSPQEYFGFLDSLPPEVFPDVAMSQSDDLDLKDPEIRRLMLKGALAVARRYPTTETWSKVLYLAVAAEDRRAGATAVSALQGHWSPNYVQSPKGYQKLVAWTKGAPLE